MIRIFLLALLLASCGGDSGSSSSSSSSSFFSFLGADPYIVNGTFFYDQNDNGIYDQGEPISTSTDTNGNGSFSTIIPAGGKIIQLTGGVMDGFNYIGKLKGISNGVGGIILSPLTTLTTNGFTNQQILDLLNSAGISITEDQLDQNPMESPELMRAALTLSQGMMASLKGFDLSPSDVTFSGGAATFNTPYADTLFRQASVVYGQLINQTSFNSNLTNLSKTSSSFFTFMNNFGADIFVTPQGSPTPEIANAEAAANDVVAESLNSYEPIDLALVSGNFSAEVLKNQTFNPGFYDLLGLDFINIYTRQVDNTIPNYPFSPRKIRVNFFGASIGTTTMTVPNEINKRRSWTLNTSSNLVNYVGSITQINGETPSNAQVVNGLPISTYNESDSIILRIAEIQGTSIPENEINIRLAGEGNSIFTYFGIDWGSDPTDKTAWLVDNTRTNNCIIDSTPTDNCNQPVTYFYNSQKENANIKSFSALTHASSIGTALPSGAQLKFTIRNTPLGASTSEPPVDYTVSKLELEPASFVKVSCSNPMGCLAVKVGQQNPRSPLEDSTDISFLAGYESFPSDYKVYAVNKVFLKVGDNEDVSCSTSATSSFFKDNMLLLKLNCPTNFPKTEYLFIDLASRIGVLASYEKDWKEGDLLKFKYRDFNRITLKDILP